MTFSATPFALQNGSHSADLFRQAVSSLVPPGGGIITTGDLAVTQTGTPSMNVSVGVGRCWIPGTNVGNVVGGNFSSQAMYYGQNPSAYTASVATSDPVNPRIDVVYASVQDSQYAGTTNSGVIAVAAGAPTSGAAYPANAPTLPANSMALAWIIVPANASSIVNANITSLATRFSQAQTGSPVTTDTNWSYNGGLIQHLGKDRTHVTMSLKMTRSGGAFTLNTSYIVICNLVPTAWCPPVQAYTNINLHSSGGVYKATLPAVISATGDLLLQAPSGSVTVSTGDFFHISTGWHY